MSPRGGPQWWHPRLTSWVDRVDARWRALGIPLDPRAEWRRELVVDVAQARLAGAELDELTDIDPIRFAEDVAVAQALTVAAEPGSTPEDSSGANRPVPTRCGFVVLSLAGAALGGLLALGLLYPAGLALVDRLATSGTEEGALILALHVLAAVVSASTGGLVVAWGYRTSTRRNRLALTAAGGLLAAGPVAAALTIAFASATGYSTRASVVTMELGMVATTCIITMATVAHRLAPPRASARA